MLVCNYNGLRRLLEGSGNTVWRTAYVVLRFVPAVTTYAQTPDAQRHTVLLRSLNAANQSDELPPHVIRFFVQVSEIGLSENVQIASKDQIVLQLLARLQGHSQVANEFCAFAA